MWSARPLSLASLRPSFFPPGSSTMNCAPRSSAPSRFCGRSFVPTAVSHIFQPRTSYAGIEQTLYVNGQVALAFARAYDVFGREADRAISARLLAQTAGPDWSFFGSEYFFGSEHWTCLAAGGLCASAPAGVGEFCSRWMAFLRRLQY